MKPKTKRKAVRAVRLYAVVNDANEVVGETYFYARDAAQDLSMASADRLVEMVERDRHAERVLKAARVWFATLGKPAEARNAALRVVEQQLIDELKNYVRRAKR